MKHEATLMRSPFTAKVTEGGFKKVEVRVCISYKGANLMCKGMNMCRVINFNQN
jgi:hypothetical protein